MAGPWIVGADMRFDDVCSVCCPVQEGRGGERDRGQAVPIGSLIGHACPIR